MSPGDFTGALALAANGVAVITTDGPAGRAGLTVSSLCSVCADPPLLLACVNTDNEFCDFAARNGVFALNLLATRHTGLANVFAGLAPDPYRDRFLSGRWSTARTGAPMLDDALVALDCSLESSLDQGTHRIHIGRTVHVLGHDGSPLVYAQREFRQTCTLPDDSTG